MCAYKQPVPRLYLFMTSSVYVLKFSGLLPPSALSVLIHTTLFCGPNFDVQKRNQVPRNLATDLAASPRSTEDTTTDLKSHHRHLPKLVPSRPVRQRVSAAQHVNIS
jgi:hypothetical protein